MNASKSLERVILKILSGVQAGVEVSLTPGEYTIGSGPEDDIQFIDVSLKLGQARLRVGAGKIEIAGGSGAVAVGKDLKIDAGSQWHDVEPLDIITVGMIRFVLGPPNANWTTLLEEDSEQKKEPLKSRHPYVDVIQSALSGSRKYAQLLLPATALIAVIFVGIWYFSSGEKTRLTPHIVQGDAEKLAREALDQFPFGRSVLLKREVDGTIYATGFVKDGFERRALVTAVEKTGAQVYFRLGVLDALRNEIAEFIKSEKVSVSYTLSPAGDLTLEGLILDEGAAQRFLDKIRGAIAGVKLADSRIRTAKSLLDELQKLTRTAQIDQFVLLRVDGELIEVTGIMPVDKIDSWVGFLTAYSRRFGKDIALRSFVQLQKPGTTDVASQGQPVVIDRDRLLNGQYKVDDLFANSSGQIPPLVDAVTPLATQGEAGSPRDRFDVLRLTQQANELIAKGSESKDFELLMNRRAAMEGGEASKYMPLLPVDSPQSPACRPGSQLTADNLPTAIFWLDLLSVSSTYSLAKFAPEDQSFILEAALDPRLAKECFARARGSTKMSSFYLAEAPQNPNFIRYLLRDYRSYSLDVSGASATGARYVQARNGEKMSEGKVLDGANRLATVGELGSVIQQKSGYSTVIYAQQLNWLNQR
ncbi:MAG: FHA domain-containing protein [Pseudolabrys sp.]